MKWHFPRSRTVFDSARTILTLRTFLVQSLTIILTRYWIWTCPCRWEAAKWSFSFRSGPRIKMVARKLALVPREVRGKRLRTRSRFTSGEVTVLKQLLSWNTKLARQARQDSFTMASYVLDRGRLSTITHCTAIPPRTDIPGLTEGDSLPEDRAASKELRAVPFTSWLTRFVGTWVEGYGTLLNHRSHNYHILFQHAGYLAERKEFP